MTDRHGQLPVNRPYDWEDELVEADRQSFLCRAALAVAVAFFAAGVPLAVAGHLAGWLLIVAGVAAGVAIVDPTEET